MRNDITNGAAAGTQESPSTSFENKAVERCFRVWRTVLDSERGRGESIFSATATASMAYRHAMPSLTGYENIRDFIACTAKGILIGAIDSKDSTKLLYAAQVALGSVRSAPAQTLPRHPNAAVHNYAQVSTEIISWEGGGGCLPADKESQLRRPALKG